MNRFGSLTKSLMWSMALLLVAFAAGCGSGSNDPLLGRGLGPSVPGAPPGAVPPGASCATAGPTIPTVNSSEPTNGNQVAPTSTTGVAGGGKLITATFSLAMDSATINATNFTLAPVGGVALVPASVGYNAATRVATLTTSSALLPGTSYTAVITQGVTSATVPLACVYAFNFTTVNPAATGLAPVNLGRAAPFAIASAAGVTNTGASTINGNVVLDPTTTCNAIQIPPTTVGTPGTFGACGVGGPTLNGQVISPLFPDAGATSGGIKADLLSAYNSILPANLPGATVLGCGTIGTGGGAGVLIGCAGNATLPPGVYMSQTSSTIGVTGILTLDGKGDSNARFVFQAPSALTTAAGAPGAPGSQIVLINGAKASNVWWQVGSSATIGTYALFQGNVLADTSVTLGTSATSCGRLLGGAVTSSGLLAFDTNVVSVPGNSNAPASCQ